MPRKSTRYSGIWWIPSASERHVAGTLRESPGGRLTLSITGSLTGETPGTMPRMLPIILGSVRKEGSITLDGCYRRASSRSAATPSLVTETLDVDRAYFGSHFENVSDLVFSSAYLHYPNLQDWAGGSDWLKQTDIPLPDFIAPEFTIHRPRAASLFAKAPWGSLELRAEVAWGGDFLSTARLERRMWFFVTLNEAAGLERWQTFIIRPLANFLSLAIGAVSDPLGITVLGRHAGVEGHRSPVKVRDSRFPAMRRMSRRRVPWVGHMPLPLREFADRFGDVLTRWIRLHQDMTLILDVFFSAHNARGNYIEHQFFSIVQALEAYHRLRVRRHESPENEHQQRLDAILGACPSLHREWLSKQLEHSNDVSLRRRLRELLSTSPMTRYIAPDQKRARHEIARYRNAIAHGGGDTHPTIGGSYGLLHLTAVVSLLMQERLLCELGFPQEQAGLRLKSTREFRYAMRESGEG
jgi:hypothetical protein